MGIAFVLIFWAVFGSIASAVGAGCFYWAARLLTRSVHPRPKWFLRIAMFFPLACFAWAGSVFVFQAVINVAFMHRDIGLGDGWDCPLPDGFAISFTDVTEFGTVYNPRTQLSRLSIQEKEDAIDGVRLLQIADPYLIGAVDTHTFQHFRQQTNAVDHYFVLNTRTDKRELWGARSDVEAWMAQHHIQSQLVPVSDVYDRYRLNWFSYVTLFLFVVPPAVAFGLLVWWGLRIRLTNATIPA